MTEANQQTKECPHCTGEILNAALVCRHCKKELDPAKAVQVRQLIQGNQATPSAACPHCSETIVKGGEICPFCKVLIPAAPSSQPADGTPTQTPPAGSTSLKPPQAPLANSSQSKKANSAGRLKTRWIVTICGAVVALFAVGFLIIFPRPQGWSCSKKNDCDYPLECIPGESVLKGLRMLAKMDNKDMSGLKSECAQRCTAEAGSSTQGNCPAGYVCAYYNDRNFSGPTSVCKKLTEEGKDNLEKRKNNPPEGCKTPNVNPEGMLDPFSSSISLDPRCHPPIPKKECLVWEGYCLSAHLADLFETY